MNNTILDYKILDSANYREFLMGILCQGKSKIPHGKLANLSRNSGISRSFLSEILNGKKSISPNSFIKISKALKLSSELSQFFSLLISVEEDHFRKLQFDISLEQAKLKLKNLKCKIIQKTKLTEDFKKIKQLEKLSYDIFLIYAALGPIQTGSSFSDICRKTNLDPIRVQIGLEKLIEYEWVEKNNQIYFATTRSIDFENIQDIGFQKAVAQSINELNSNLKEIVENEKNLLFFSAISINSLRLGEFKNHLRTTILDLLDQYQDDAGDTIKKINLSVF